MRSIHMLAALASISLVAARAVPRQDAAEGYYIDKCVWDDGSYRRLCEIDLEAENNVLCEVLPGPLIPRWRLDKCLLNDGRQPAGIDEKGKILVIPNTDPVYAESDHHADPRDVTEEAEEAEEVSTISPYAADCEYLDRADGARKLCAVSANRLVCAPPDTSSFVIDLTTVFIPLCLLKDDGQPAGLDENHRALIDYSQATTEAESLKRDAPIVVEPLTSFRDVIDEAVKQQEGDYLGRKSVRKFPEGETSTWECDWLHPQSSILHNCYVVSPVSKLGEFYCTPYDWTFDPWKSGNNICEIESDGEVDGLNILGQMDITLDDDLRTRIYTTWDNVRKGHVEEQQPPHKREESNNIVTRNPTCEFYNPDTDVTMTCFGDHGQMFCIPVDYSDIVPEGDGSSQDPICALKEDGRLADLDADGNVQIEGSSHEREAPVDNRGYDFTSCDYFKDSTKWLEICEMTPDLLTFKFLCHPWDARDGYVDISQRAVCELNESGNPVGLDSDEEEFEIDEDPIHRLMTYTNFRKAIRALPEAERPNPSPLDPPPVVEGPAEEDPEDEDTDEEDPTVETPAEETPDEEDNDDEEPAEKDPDDESTDDKRSIAVISTRGEQTDAAQKGLERRGEDPNIFEAIGELGEWVTDKLTDTVEDWFDLDQPKGHSPRAVDPDTADAKHGEVAERGEGEPSDLPKKIGETGTYVTDKITDAIEDMFGLDHAHSSP